MNSWDEELKQKGQNYPKKGLKQTPLPLMTGRQVLPFRPGFTEPSTLL